MMMMMMMILMMIKMLMTMTMTMMMMMMIDDDVAEGKRSARFFELIYKKKPHIKRRVRN